MEYSMKIKVSTVLLVFLALSAGCKTTAVEKDSGLKNAQKQAQLLQNGVLFQIHGNSHLKIRLVL